MLPESATTARLPPVADPVRLQALFVTHHRFIWRLLRRLGLGEETADDAAQQTFLIAAERLADIRPGAERSFLYGTAIRLFRDLRRAELRMVRDAEEELESPHASVEERIDQGRALLLLDAALARMDGDLREVFVLFELERLPSPQIAELVGVPVGTVASRLRRAREQFHSVAVRLARPKGGSGK